MFNDQSAISAHCDTAHAQSSARPEHPDGLECEVCGRTFVDKYILKRHLSALHDIGGSKSFDCDLCPFVTKHKQNLKTHLLHVHGVGNVQTAQCDVCSKVFKSKTRLKQHTRLAHN